MRGLYSPTGRIPVRPMPTSEYLHGRARGSLTRLPSNYKSISSAEHGWYEQGSARRDGFPLPSSQRSNVIFLGLPQRNSELLDGRAGARNCRDDRQIGTRSDGRCLTRTADVMRPGRIVRLVLGTRRLMHQNGIRVDEEVPHRQEGIMCGEQTCAGFERGGWTRCAAANGLECCTTQRHAKRNERQNRGEQAR